jgi:hypothetical protein
VTATTYIAVSGSIRTGFTHYGPFGSVDAAQAWLSHEYRTEETRGATIVPLFGGIGITDEPAACDKACPTCDRRCQHDVGHDGDHRFVDAEVEHEWEPEPQYAVDNPQQPPCAARSPHYSEFLCLMVEGHEGLHYDGENDWADARWTGVARP